MTARRRRVVLPPEVAERLGPYYVYILSDPQDGFPFYVGKGTGGRLLAHGFEADLAPEVGQSQKIERIREIRLKGLEPDIEIARFGLTEIQAFHVEAALIDCSTCLPEANGNTWTGSSAVSTQ